MRVAVNVSFIVVVVVVVVVVVISSLLGSMSIIISVIHRKQILNPKVSLLNSGYPSAVNAHPHAPPFLPRLHVDGHVGWNSSIRIIWNESIPFLCFLFLKHYVLLYHIWCPCMLGLEL